MAISLVKGQKISLAKEAGTSLSKIFMGLGWDAVKKSGFLGKVFGSGDIDLDASCLLFDANKKLLEIVYFRNLNNKNKSVVHSGDNLTGAGEGDDEVINVDLNALPSEVAHLVFTVSSFRGQTFNAVENAFCRVVNQANKSEIARYTLSGGGDYTGMIMTSIYKHNDEWKMRAIGEYVNGKTAKEYVPDIVKIL